MTTWGYARVSTANQDLSGQIGALRRAGVESEHLVIEHASGARADRPKLADTMREVVDALRVEVRGAVQKDSTE